MTSSSRRIRRAHGRAGFTLLELLVAGVLASLVLGAITISLSQLGKARNLARDRVEAFQRASTAMDSVRADVVSALRSDDLFDCRVLITPGSSRGTGYDRSELLVFNASLRPIREIDYQGEGSEYETAYRVEDDELGSALWRRRDPVPDDVPDGGGVAQPVADGVVGLRIEASDGNGSWMEEWDSDFDGIPRMVRITVTATGTPVGSDGEPLTPEVTLRTVVALDRVVPPKSDEPKDEEGATTGDGTGTGTDGTGTGATGGAGAGSLGTGGGLGTVDGGVTGGNTQVPGRPGAGEGQGQGGTRPGGTPPRGNTPMPPSRGGGGRGGAR